VERRIAGLGERRLLRVVQRRMAWVDDVVTAGHWRTRDGVEVDVLFERSDGSVAAVEIKSGSRVDVSEARGIMALADRLGDSWLGGVVLYTGAHSYTLDRARGIHVLPVDALWLAVA
jgi:predicted AAA+ superfamily ATPase